MTVKSCQWCGKAINITGDYHRASARKYCDECREKKRARDRIQYARSGRRERAELHRQTKKALTEMERTVFLLRTENQELRRRIAQLKRENQY